MGRTKTPYYEDFVPVFISLSVTALVLCFIREIVFSISDKFKIA
jgi:hypothetical protein